MLTASPISRPLSESPDTPLLKDLSTPLAKQKPITWFGYLPLWSECVPLDAVTGSTDWAGVAANVGAGLVIGLREVLGGIVSASLIFSTTGIPELSAMFPFGIGMIWYSTAFGALWYTLFGRMQYVYGTAQDVIGILQAVMLARIAGDLTLAGKPDKIAATALAAICLSSVLTGLSSVAIGKLGLGKFALLFPAPVTSGFLGAIGFVILRSSLQTSSGVEFHQFYPVSTEDFCQTSSLEQVGLQVATVLFIRMGPVILEFFFPGNSGVQKLGGVICQLLPLFLFHVVIRLFGITMESLTDAGWVYPKESSGGLLDHLSRYSIYDVDVGALLGTLPEMPPLILMAILCTATGALTVSDRFPRGPDGDPAPMEALNFDKELTTVGVSSVLLGLTGGTLTFHTFTSIQLRLDGGTHRIGVLCVPLFVFGAFVSNIPFGHYIPKWYLSGLFMNTAFHFLKGALLSYQSLPQEYWKGYRVVSLQYVVTLSAIGISIFTSPANAIFAGMVLSVSIFLVQSAQLSPVVNVVMGNRVVSRTKRPSWEMQALRREGHRIMLLYLQGQLFFGSARKLVSVLDAALAGEEVRYCILSFARVPSVDPSAARHLKTIKEKAKLIGCELICCRTNHEVYGALVAAGVITAADQDLVQYLRGLRWRTKASVTKCMDEGHMGTVVDEGHMVSLDDVLTRQRSDIPEWRQIDVPDAFAHETDALDYCDERIVADFCYSGDFAGCVQSYQWAYRNTCTLFVRLEERHFEEMNNLRAGVMSELKPHCFVMVELPKWDKVEIAYGSLCFILRGSVSLVQILPQAYQSTRASITTGGFSFREGKRLRRRYPPGHVVGKVTFFLAKSDRVMDKQLAPQIVVSSKYGDSTELWVLKRSSWDSLPASLKAELTTMLCEQLADDAQHASLQEH
mmetsp:Transcript_30187/g.86468  ORF Transcript_30187/g.86468 Transcript_30187/m.86468 type:complete len:908 (+) Transcript_30187:116-2839(+)